VQNLRYKGIPNCPPVNSCKGKSVPHHNIGKKRETFAILLKWPEISDFFDILVLGQWLLSVEKMICVNSGYVCFNLKLQNGSH